MSKFYLAMYTINLKINRKILPLGKIPVDGKDLSFRDICENIFKEGEFIHDSIKVNKVKEESDDKTFFHCQLELAEYGNERGLYDSEKDIEKDKIKELDKVLEPFFFMFALPSEDDCNKGFLVIEKKKSKPIMGHFRKMFNEKLKEFNNELRIYIEPHNPLELEDIINEGIVSEYTFSIYENDYNKFEDKTPSKIKISLPSLRRVHPTDVDKSKIISRIEKILSHFNRDTKINMKVKHSDNQEVLLDIDNIFNYNTFYLDISEEIETSKNNPTYESMIEVCKKYIKSNFSYYLNQENKTLLESLG